MNITKMLIRTSSPFYQRETVYRVVDGDKVTFIHETIYDGPCTGEGEGWEEAAKPNFRLLKPEEAEANPDLLSFLEAASKGEEGKHPRSATRFDYEQCEGRRG